MEKITCTTKLPKWFLQEDRYSRFETASLSYLASELLLRRRVNSEIDQGIIGSIEQQELFSAREPFQNEDPELLEAAFRHHEPDCESIQLLNAGSLLLLAKEQYVVSANPFSKVNKENFDVYYGEGCAVGLGLAYATDSEILKELKALLPKVRERLKIYEPDRHHMNRRIAGLREGGVFECIDLELWAKANGISIHHDVYASAIKRGTFSHKNIPDLVKRAKVAVTIDFSDQLEKHLNSTG